MKKLTVVIVFLILGMTRLGYCHPPSDIIITFDKGTKIVKAVIQHNVQNPAKHFIYKVDVSVNGNGIIEHKISQQDNNENQTVEYKLPDVKEGDTIGVEGYCNISGALEKEIKI
jgi:desulfoferrodoxin (superoxide reductase-like protein)